MLAKAAQRASLSKAAGGTTESYRRGKHLYAHTNNKTALYHSALSDVYMNLVIGPNRDPKGDGQLFGRRERVGDVGAGGEGN